MQRCQFVSPLGLLPGVFDLIEDVLVHKSFLGNRVAHDVSDTENGASVGLRRQEGRKYETKECLFHANTFRLNVSRLGPASFVNGDCNLMRHGFNESVRIGCNWYPVKGESVGR